MPLVGKNVVSLGYIDKRAECKVALQLIQYSAPSYPSFFSYFTPSCFRSVHPLLFPLVIVFCIACLTWFSRYTNSRFHDLEETFRLVEVYIHHSPVCLDLLYLTGIPSACKNLFYRPAVALPTAQR